jgi:hypothetical protein
MASKRYYSIYRTKGGYDPLRYFDRISAYSPRGILTYLVEGGYEGTFVWGTRTAWDRWERSKYKDVRGMYRAVLSK